MTPSFRHTCELPIRFVDIDTFGHVNNANYLTYAEEARILYFKEVLPEINWKDEGLILASAKVDYIQPILLKDRLLVFTRCSRIGNKSFDLEYLFYSHTPEKSVLKAKAYTVLVSYNYLTEESIEVPENWRKKLQEYDLDRA